MPFEEPADERDDVRTVQEATGHAYRIESDRLLDADVVGTDEFPQFGTFVECSDAETGDFVYVECPSSLQSWLAKTNADTGDTFHWHSASKNDDGRWTIDCRLSDENQTRL